MGGGFWERIFRIGKEFEKGPGNGCLFFLGGGP